MTVKTRRARTTQPEVGPVSGKQLAKFVFHSASAGAMLFSYTSIATVLGKLTKAEYGGDFQYLTVLGMFITVVTMMLSAINDIVPTVYASKRVLALAAMPVEITISAIYWPIIIAAPALMVPPNPNFVPSPDHPELAAPLVFLPLWMDLGLHALPAIALIIDFFFLERKYYPPTSTRTAPLVAIALGTGYSLWVEHCASINGKFPYPFLTLMKRENRNYVYAGASVFALLVFRVLNALHK